VERERPKYGDKRLWIVSLTAKGMECIRYAYQALRRSSLRLAALGLVLAPGVREERRGFADMRRLAFLWRRCAGGTGILRCSPIRGCRRARTTRGPHGVSMKRGMLRRCGRAGATRGPALAEVSRG
jgi:hypothetical protein